MNETDEIIDLSNMSEENIELVENLLEKIKELHKI